MWKKGGGFRRRLQNVANAPEAEQFYSLQLIDK
jgi:hypothetical protein